MMKDWLGESYDYELQKGEDLGARLIHAMEVEFRNGAEQLIFLGGDCPYVDQACLDMAYSRLSALDVVLGPASDGGYYLIGVRRSIPALFEDIPWGTDAVFKTTLDRCETLGLDCALLPEESDVDDLKGWETARAFMAN
jgi:rSAM/selenodomain-associated transferase 1